MKLIGKYQKTMPKRATSHSESDALELNDNNPHGILGNNGDEIEELNEQKEMCDRQNKVNKKKKEEKEMSVEEMNQLTQECKDKDEEMKTIKKEIASHIEEKRNSDCYNHMVQHINSEEYSKLDAECDELANRCIELRSTLRSTLDDSKVMYNALKEKNATLEERFNIGSSHVKKKGRQKWRSKV